MFRELIHMEKLDSVKLILKDGLLSQMKTEEFFSMINRIISYEDEMIKLRKEFAEDKFVDAGFEQDKFHNYDELVIEKINMEHKEDFARQFKQDKLIFPFIPFWYTPLNGFEKSYSDILRRMLKLKLPDAKTICNFLSCNNLDELTTLVRHNK
jgi:hypothetical protein